jgi:hypothetical protein
LTICAATALALHPITYVQSLKRKTFALVNGASTTAAIVSKDTHLRVTSWFASLASVNALSATE